MQKNERFFLGIPVVSGSKLVGMLSLTDLQRLSFTDSYGSDEEAEVDTLVYDMLSIEQVMISHPVTIRIDQSIETAAKIFLKGEFHALPVVEGDRLVGILTTTDLIRYYADNCG
ncbi:MAG: CBS domain-containing protein [Saprospiraceae bacterium]|nr:CBS domain-containing protein [Saprospiraceae bacterium]